MTTPIYEVPATITGEALPQTPELPGNDTALEFSIVPAKNQDGPTVVLAGRYRATGSVLDAYGGQFPRPIRVVAIDFSTSQVFSQALRSEKSPPVRVLVDEGTPPSPPGRSQSASFTVDLPIHLGLPPQEATYEVFLWLDDVVTPAQRVVVAEDPKRTGGLASHRRTEQALRFVGPQAAPPADPSLQLSPIKGRPARDVRGQWTPNPKALEPDAAPFPLVVLAFNQRDREFGWTSIDLRGKAAADVSAFELDSAVLAPPTEDPQNTFLVAAIPGPQLASIRIRP